MREYRTKLVLETVLEAKDVEAARNTALSEFVHAVVDEGIDREQVVVLLEDCGSPCSEHNETCKGTGAGDCDCRDCWECSGDSHLVDLENLGGFGPRH